MHNYLELSSNRGGGGVQISNSPMPIISCAFAALIIQIKIISSVEYANLELSSQHAFYNMQIMPNRGGAVDF